MSDAIHPATEVDEDVLLARAYLSRVGEPASVGLWSLVRKLGPVDAVRALQRGRVGDRLLRETAVRRELIDPAADLAAGQRHGLRLVVPESDEWPHFAFGALERAAEGCVGAYADRTFTRSESGDPIPPLALWVRGGPAGSTVDLSTLGVRSVGLVGARASTSYGEHVTTDLAYGLASRDVVVISGGAYGIDAAAHRAAIAARGQTVLVSAGGLDRPYPVGNSTLFDRVAEHGLLISESPPGCAPQRHRFLTRNRIIAALSTGVVVIEAASRSGAANTANHCRALGRPLMAVPGPVTSAMSVGCHELLRRDVDPALLVTSVDDVLAVVGNAGEGLFELSALAEPGDLRDELDRLEPLARTVFNGLQARQFSRPDDVAARSGVSALDVIRVLPTLDLAGLIETSDAGYRLAARLRPSSKGRG